jgi:alkylated DNA repair dioxygenase AlkB
LTKKGKTLHLYDPADIAAHTPCSIIHNFLAPELATALLHELLPEVCTYQSATFKLFDNVVKSPHTACLYVNDLAERERQRTEYLYNGSSLDDVRAILPEMRKVSDLVEEAVNQEVQKRIREHYPDGKKLRYQSPARWRPNAAFVNCYDTGKQSVGFHSDQLSYLGPRAIIGSLSLGVAREFRVRKIVPRDEDDKGEAADASGQISIHLPHNSLLVMHAEMQEEWKHSIAPALSIDPHPVAGNKRINITYRWYRDSFHPRFTPKCKCGVPTVLKTVQKQRATRGRYMWMCQVGAQPGGGDGCGFFAWAEFTDDGEPIWNRNGPPVDASKS